MNILSSLNYDFPRYEYNAAKSTALTQVSRENTAIEANEETNFFNGVNSANVIHLPITANRRDDFLQNQSYETAPPVIAHSEFVPAELVIHLMTKKKKLALGKKFETDRVAYDAHTQGRDRITNMEAAMHTFVTPLAIVNMTGDYYYSGKHRVAKFDGNQGRQVILSAAIQPDFECEGNNAVMLKVAEVTDMPVEGGQFIRFTLPNLAEKHNLRIRQMYDECLQRHMTYYLTSSHRLPSKAEVAQMPVTHIKNQVTAKKFLQRLMKKPAAEIAASVQDQFAVLNGHTISLEVLFNAYVHQLRNELTALERNTPQGYVYTIDPPAIFATQLGRKLGVEILNRLQAAAFSYVRQSMPLGNMKTIAFNDYEDKTLISCLQKAMPNTAVVSKASLFDATTHRYKGPQGYALVLHNNSDGFGQNIQYELPEGSMDGALGSFSDAAVALRRERPDLLSRIISIESSVLDQPYNPAS